MSNLVRCGVFAIVCLLSLGAWSQSALAMKIDSAATKGATDDAATPNKTAPESQGAGNGADAARPANRMNSDGAPAK